MILILFFYGCATNISVNFYSRDKNKTGVRQFGVGNKAAMNDTIKNRADTSK